MKAPEPLPWLDVPTEAGWYWFRVNPSTVIRGPVEVIRLTGPTTLLYSLVRLPAGLYTVSGWKSVASYQRSWAGPLARPVDDEPTILENDAEIKARSRAALSSGPAARAAQGEEG